MHGGVHVNTLSADSHQKKKQLSKDTTRRQAGAGAHRSLCSLTYLPEVPPAVS